MFENCSPLHYAIQKRHQNVVELLIHHGSDTMTKNDQGDSPLHFASLFGSIQIVESLISHGAGIRAKNIIDNSININCDFLRDLLHDDKPIIDTCFGEYTLHESFDKTILFNTYDKKNELKLLKL